MITLKKKFSDSYNFVFNKTVMMRVDLNVPISDGKITDSTRISKIVPTILRLLEQKAKIIIISHLGRPKGNKDPDLSLFPIYKFLKKKPETNVYFFMGNFDDKTKDKFSHLKEGEVILIENIRYFKEEFLKASNKLSCSSLIALFSYNKIKESI